MDLILLRTFFRRFSSTFSSLGSVLSCYIGRIFKWQYLADWQPGTVLDVLNARQLEMFTEIPLKVLSNFLRASDVYLAMSNVSKNYLLSSLWMNFSR